MYPSSMKVIGDMSQDGRSVELTTTDTDVMWRNVGDTAWNELCPKSELGNTILTGVLDPVLADGKPGDIFINTATLTFFGQKTAVGWPVGLPMKGGSGNGISSAAVSYQSSVSGATAPTGTWLSSPPAVTKGQYLWSRLVVTYTDTTSSIVYMVSYQGLDGAPGANATTTAIATTTTNGLMSSTDKAKLDGINSMSASAVASGVRVAGTAFTISSTRNAWATYTLSYSLTATLALGQTIQVSTTVDGAEVARSNDGILLGLAGSLIRSETISIFVPAGKQVLFTKTGTAAVAVTIVCGQEVLM